MKSEKHTTDSNSSATPGPAPSARDAALIIALPGGLTASGIATWAVRLVNGLAALGRHAGLILHTPAPGHRPLSVWLHPRVQVTDLSHLGPVEDAVAIPERASAMLAGYERAVDAVPGIGPVILAPTHLGDCYGLCAALLRGEMAEHAEADRASRVRIAGWVHTDTPYDLHVQRHFAQALSASVAVTDRLARVLSRTLADAPGAGGVTVRHIPYGAPGPTTLVERTPLDSRPLRLIYAGRLERYQKRVLALPAMSRELLAMGIAHEMVIVGDGPASQELDAEIAVRGASTPRSVIRLLPKTHNQLEGLYAASDIVVLPSRHESLPIALIEAMRCGCVPVATTPAGAEGELIEDGVHGVLVHAADDAPEEDVGRVLARGVVRTIAHLPAMSGAARERAAGAFAIEQHIARAMHMIDEVGATPRRLWPMDRAWAFSSTDSTGASGSVPAHGARRLDELLRALGGRRVAIHGTGRHTRELLPIIASHAPVIVAFCDDDPAQLDLSATPRQSRPNRPDLLGLPVVSPREAARAGVTDVVISSWINEGAILARREVYERQGIRVHAIYEPIESPA